MSSKQDETKQGIYEQSQIDFIQNKRMLNATKMMILKMHKVFGWNSLIVGTS